MRLVLTGVGLGWGLGLWFEGAVAGGGGLHVWHLGCAGLPLLGLGGGL